MEFGNPIIGQEELIRSAIKSRDYVSGNSGWRISSDGEAEFAELTVNFGGLNGRIVIGTQSIQFFDFEDALYAEIGTSNGYDNLGGFISYDVFSTIRYAVQTAFNGIHFFDADNHPAMPASITYERSGTVLIPADPCTLTIGSGYQGAVGVSEATIKLVSDSATNSRIEMNSPVYNANGDREQAGVHAVSVPVAATSFTRAVVFGEAYSSPPIVKTEIDSGAGHTARWVTRAINRTTTGFTIFGFRTDAADPAVVWPSTDITWQATPATQ